VDDINSRPSGGWEVSQAEVDWLVSDQQRMMDNASGEGSNIIEGQVDGPLGASPGPDEDAQGEDELDDEGGTYHEPSAGKGVEQGAIVSLYLIPSINRAQEFILFCFGLTESVGKNR
jgi:hypothetical protein